MTNLLTGDRPNWLNIAAMVAVGLSLAVLVLTEMPHFDWRSVLLALLAADIGAGLISNATEATRKAWREGAGKRGRAVFLLVHLTVYPAALFWLAGAKVMLAVILTGILAAKILMFAGGQVDTASG